MKISQSFIFAWAVTTFVVIMWSRECNRLFVEYIFKRIDGFVVECRHNIKKSKYDQIWTNNAHNGIIVSRDSETTNVYNGGAFASAYANHVTCNHFRACSQQKCFISFFLFHPFKSMVTLIHWFNRIWIHNHWVNINNYESVLLQKT